MLFRTDAIVIRRGPYSETSQVADLLTAREGRIATLVLGAHRPKSVFGGPLDLLTRGVADVRRRKRSELDVLQSFRITHPYRGVRSTSLRFAAASHALELVRAFAWPRDLESELFRLLTGFLDALEAHDPATDSAVLDAWLLTLPGALLRASGLQPRLDACVACNRPVADAASTRLSFADGGIVCAVCAPRDPRAMVLSPGVRGLLVRSVRGSRAADAAPPRMADVAQARRVLDLYLEHRLERQLHARRMLERCLAAESR